MKKTTNSLFKTTTMKPLLFLLTLASITAFGQAPTRSLGLTNYGTKVTGSTYTITPGQNGEPDLLTLDIKMRPHYDTLRTVMLVTLATSRMGIAHARPGYAVMKTGDVVGYLSDRKKRLAPQVKVWGWKMIGGGR